MKLTKRLYTLSLTVTLFVTGFLLPGFSTSCTAQTETNSSPAYSCIKVPKSISFCDTEIDLTRYDRRERMDRELMAFTYMHSTSLQIIKRANRYFPIIESILKEQGVPDDFKYLMVIESNVNPLARSGAGAAIVNNAKTRRVSVCNAMDCLLLHRGRLADLPALCAPLVESRVILYADEPAYQALEGNYPAELLQPATLESYGTEFLDYKMAIKTVDDVAEAVTHIYTYGSGHSECIVTEDKEAAAFFTRAVDAACVYVNAPTSFTDGAQFGLGAEIGISTQKLHARGPMGLREMTTYKWIVEGDGQVRKK